MSHAPCCLASSAAATMVLAAIVMAPWSILLRRRLRADHLAVPDRVFGLRWSGAMSKPRLLGLMRHLPKKGVSEIYLHPATGPYLGSVATYRYAEELAALTDPEVVAAARDSNIRLGGFGRFPLTYRIPVRRVILWRAKRFVAP